MAFEGSSFNLYTDATLLSPFSGVYTLVHQTSLSDNPQDFVLYLGSVLEERQLQAAASPGVTDISLTPTDILPHWTAATSYIVGDKVQPVSGNGFVYKCTVAGTSHATTEPTWPVVTIGTTVVDNTCTWALLSAHHAITEIKLALSSGALGAATPGAALALGDTVLGGEASNIPIYIRVTNAVTTVSNNTGNEEIGIVINACIESEVP
jgi:hypothetical protein